MTRRLLGLAFVMMATGCAAGGSPGVTTHHTTAPTDTDASTGTGDDSGGTTTAPSGADSGGTTTSPSGADSGGTTSTDAGSSGTDATTATDDSSTTSDGASTATDSGSAATDSGAVVTDSGSSATDSGSVAKDSGSSATDSGSTATDSGSGATDSGKPATDSGGGDTGTVNATSGLACSSNATCDPLGLGTSLCTAPTPLYSSGSIDPAGMCIDTSACTPSTTTINTCDGTTGVCLNDGTGTGVCLPKCTFDNSGAAPVGCASGANGCNVAGWGSGASGAYGVGYCFGGCFSDSDCKVTGEKCDTLTALCKTASKIVTPTKALGAACTSADGTSGACNCYYNTTTLKGACTQACKVGGAACPTGFVCDAGLPTTDATTGTPLFSAVPTGIVGQCTKTCTSTADCASGLTCQSHAGVGMVCSP